MDASQSVIAKQLEEMGLNINPRYKAEVVGKLEEDLDNIYSNVNTTYQGDFGRAIMILLNLLVNLEHYCIVLHRQLLKRLN